MVRQKQEIDVELEIIEEGNLSDKETDQALDRLADWLIDLWLKKNNANAESEINEDT